MKMDAMRRERGLGEADEVSEERKRNGMREDKGSARKRIRRGEGTKMNRKGRRKGRRIRNMREIQVKRNK